MEKKNKITLAKNNFLDFGFPKHSITDKLDSFLVKFELPGINKDEIKLNIRKDAISVNASNSSDKEKKGENYYFREKSFIEYSKTLTMPALINSKSAKTKFENGILTINVKKLETKSN